jgi:hypothetical protein
MVLLVIGSFNCKVSVLVDKALRLVVECFHSVVWPPLVEEEEDMYKREMSG